MQVKSLEITRRPSYDSEYPNQLVGLITLQGPTGSQEVRLSNAGLSKIFSVIAAEVQETAQGNAAMVRGGLEDAVHEPIMVAASNLEVLK